MNKNIKYKLAIALVILFVFTFLTTAGFLIAQVKTQDQTQVKAVMPQKVSKLFGTVGRPDPFIPVSGAGANMPAGVPAGISQQGRAVAAIGGAATLTGTFIVNGKKYAIIKFSGANYILQEGMTKFGYTVINIASKKVVLRSKSGIVTLKLAEFTYSTVEKSQPIPSLGGTEKSLTPPPMQPPTPAQTEQQEQMPTPQGTTK